MTSFFSQSGEFSQWWNLEAGAGSLVDVQVKGVLTGAGESGREAVAEQKLRLVVAPAQETFLYTGAGQTREDAFWSYSWDGAGRLKRMERKEGMSPEVNAVAEVVEFDYDADGRRTQKTRTIRFGNGERVERSRVLWAGWLPVMEERSRDGVFSDRRWFQWGADLSGSVGGAGGIGGLVAIIEEKGNGQVRTLLPVQDGLGNVTAVVNANGGALVARYDYGPYGEPLGEYGEAEACPFRYQTKWYDRESEHYYFGYRYYSPRLGRWLSRDPIGEAGGVNLYAYCGNDPVNRCDPLGLSPWRVYEQARRNYIHALQHGTEEEQRVASEAMTILPGDSRLSPASSSQRVLMGIVGNLVGPSDADLAVSPAQPLGRGVGHQASLHAWSFANSTAGFLSMANDPSRLITGEQSLSAQVIGQNYMQRFTYGERSGADFNMFAAELLTPFAAEKVGQLAKGSFGALRGLAGRLDWSPVFAPYRGGYAYTGVPLPGMPVFRRPGKPIRTLFHYTDEAGQTGILESKNLRPSLRARNPKDVRYGEGQYLSDTLPGTRTPAELSHDFLNIPFQGRRFTHYIEIDVTGLNVIEGRAGVFVVPNTVPLDLTNRIISSGRIP